MEISEEPIFVLDKYDALMEKTDMSLGGSY